MAFEMLADETNNRLRPRRLIEVTSFEENGTVGSSTISQGKGKKETRRLTITLGLESKKRNSVIIARSRACEQPFSMCIPCHLCAISFFLFPFLLLVRLEK